MTEIEPVPLATIIGSKEREEDFEEIAQELNSQLAERHQEEIVMVDQTTENIVGRAWPRSERTSCPSLTETQWKRIRWGEKKPL